MLCGTGSATNKVAIVDGMAEVQCLIIKEDAKTCSNLAQHFVESIDNTFIEYDEAHVIFKSPSKCLKSLLWLHFFDTFAAECFCRQRRGLRVYLLNFYDVFSGE